MEHLWKIPTSAFVFAGGLVTGRIACASIGISAPRMPSQADESIAVFYLLGGSLALTAGVAPLANKLRGGAGARWVILATFICGGFAVSSTIETSIYSAIEGTLWMIPILLVPCILTAGALAFLYRPVSEDSSLTDPAMRFLRSYTPVQWLWRVLGAMVAFPMVYFVFGIMVSPIVAEYYRQGVSELALPDGGVILSIQLLRSGLFLLITVPILVAWYGTRRQLIGFLGLAHFVFVATYDLVLAYQVPTILVVTHSVEILTDSMVYSWLFVTLMTRQS